MVEFAFDFWAFFFEALNFLLSAGGAIFFYMLDTLFHIDLVPLQLVDLLLKVSLSLLVHLNFLFNHILVSHVECRRDPQRELDIVCFLEFLGA